MASKQDEILSKIAALKTTDSIPPLDSNQQRFNQNGGFIDFLFDLIKQTSGQTNFKNVVFRGVIGELNQSTEINNSIRNIFKKAYYCNFDFIIPQKYTTESVNGITINIENIDLTGMLNIDPDSDVGKNIYEGNDINSHLNYLIYKSQFIDGDNPLSFDGPNGKLLELYSSGNKELTFKFGSFYKNKPFSLWSEDFFNSTEFFNSTNFITNLMDNLFGTTSIKNDLSINQLIGINRVERAISKLFGFCDSSNQATNNNTNNSGDGVDLSSAQFLSQNETSGDDIFDFSSEELIDIQKEAERKLSGNFTFNTCGDLPVNFDSDLIFNNLNNLFSDRGDVNYNNDNVNINVDDATNFFDNILKEGTKKLIDDGEDDIRINFANMLNELQVSFIKAIPYMLVNTVLSPKTLMYIVVANKITGNGDNINIEDIIKTISNVLGSLGANVANLIIQNITRYVLREISKLARELAVRFLRQRALDFANIFLVFANLLNIGDIDLSSCGGILDTLLTFLNGNITTPAPTVPHIILPVLNAVKPGLNHVAIINDYKAKLQEKGIETAPFYPDGTPNYQMYMMEEMIKTMTQHIKFNSKLDVGGFAGPFPIVGAGQIV